MLFCTSHPQGFAQNGRSARLVAGGQAAANWPATECPGMVTASLKATPCAPAAIMRGRARRLHSARKPGPRGTSVPGYGRNPGQAANDLGDLGAHPRHHRIVTPVPGRFPPTPARRRFGSSPDGSRGFRVPDRRAARLRLFAGWVPGGLRRPDRCAVARRLFPGLVPGKLRPPAAAPAWHTISPERYGCPGSAQPVQPCSDAVKTALLHTITPVSKLDPGYRKAAGVGIIPG